MATLIVTLSTSLARRILPSVKHAYRYARYLAKAAPIMYPRLVECNVCGWRGKHFVSSVWHEHCSCPKCGSGVRLRLLFAALAHLEPVVFANLVDNRRVLHFAPEPGLERKLENRAAEYVTADYLRPWCDLQLDISDMHPIDDGRFDLLIACDVLQHVKHDRRAIREIHRVLSPEGCAILTVNQKDHLAKTYDDPSIIDPDEREKAFGEPDQFRIYGNDFPATLESAGFQVSAVSEKDFPGHLVKKYILFPPRLSTRSLATNFRKVFFARKK